MSTNPFLPADDPRAGTCASCGALLAADQRYCLSCGARRDHARLPFQDALVPAVATPAAQGPPPALWYPPPPSSGFSMPTMLAALACVLVAFGVGILVGGNGDDQQQPIVVGGGAPAAAAAAPPTTTTDEAAAPDPSTETTKDEASSGDSGGSGDAKPSTAEDKKAAAEVAKTSTKVEKAKPVSKSIEQDLKSKDPEKARKASQSLPDVVSTGG